MHIKRVLLALALTAPAALAVLPPKAHATDGTLYEVSEAIDLKSNGKGFKSSEATLSGRIDEHSVGQPTPRLKLTFPSKK